MGGNCWKRSTHCTGISSVGIAYQLSTADLEIPNTSGGHIGIELWTKRFNSQASCPLWGSKATNATQRCGRARALRLHWDDEAESHHEHGEQYGMPSRYIPSL